MDSDSLSSSDWEMEDRIRPSTDKRQNQIDSSSESDEESDDKGSD